jgi:hypothetical protein
VDIRTKGKKQDVETFLNKKGGGITSAVTLFWTEIQKQNQNKRSSSKTGFASALKLARKSGSTFGPANRDQPFGVEIKHLKQEPIVEWKSSWA